MPIVHVAAWIARTYSLFCDPAFTASHVTDLHINSSLQESSQVPNSKRGSWEATCMLAGHNDLSLAHIETIRSKYRHSLAYVTHVTI